MPRFRKPTVLFPLLSVLILLSRPAPAAFIPTYDLGSLCYMSTDVVEATLEGYKANPAAASGMAVITVSLIGQYHPGDEVAVSDLDLYAPARPGQHCLLFIARKQFTLIMQPPKIISPKVIDMLFVDKYNRVQQYFQASNPGGLLAEGYPLPGSNDFVLNEYALDKECPTLTQERTAIAAKRADIDRLRPLLTRKPTRENIPILQSLVRERKAPRGHGLQNVIREIAQERLAELHVKPL